ncbi:hypothetical protein [Fictibacillus barbaricus]|uniref:Uncharacterized protein n=1 Tax=Fictibacillus barbaricus TaxID=182136 RepID=A0ABU1U194_9BACL|nr:hypothetical protein [Fictibacillus barbaricus]MDR7073253.1 hypothetical protein [Fictibacillus barbaricus]
MIWAYVFLFLASFVMAAFELPKWCFILVILAFFIWIILTRIYPLAWEKNAEKTKKFLKKSRHPYYRFIYELLYQDEEKAENSLAEIKQNAVKEMAKVMLWTKQEKYEEAKSTLSGMKNDDFKHYYTAVIAQKQGNLQEYAASKSQLNDAAYLTWLEAEEKALAGKKEEALGIVEDQMKTLRGLKLLTAIHYKDELMGR